MSDKLEKAADEVVEQESIKLGNDWSSGECIIRGAWAKQHAKRLGCLVRVLLPVWETLWEDAFKEGWKQGKEFFEKVKIKQGEK